MKPTTTVPSVKTDKPLLAAEMSPLANPLPTVPAEHRHARMLLENALRYAAPESGIIDPRTGYPVEGWNNEPEKGLALRSFTQLTAIGQWIEILANIVAGRAETPYLSREQALDRLALAVHTLHDDQKNPKVSAKGLLGNFLDLAPEGRRGPLTNDVQKDAFLRAFGNERGEAVWRALTTKGWLAPEPGDRDAIVRRGAGYGALHFDGPLAPHSDEATKAKIMEILDRRVVTVIFGDNANLTASLGKATGALLTPEIAGNPAVAQMRLLLEEILEAQREGYSHLYDPRTGLFYFGWDATRDRFLGWKDGQGNWQAGYMDYMVNEFRGPTSFVVARYNLPTSAVRNLGFKIKPYRMADGREIYTLAPWEGSAFQALGLSLSMMELDEPSWRKTLENVVSIEIDYSRRHNLPGFLSESYVHEGPHYTGDVGIPEIAVTSSPRITDTPSLYTLGVAYQIAPAAVEAFLAENWQAVSRLMTDHGPWEGFHTGRKEPIKVQTTAHTLSLALGLLGTGSEDMKRYLASKGLLGRLADLYPRGETVDLLSEATNVFAWTEKGRTVRSTREQRNFRVEGEQLREVGVAFVPNRPEGVSLSNGLLTIRYRSGQAIDPATIAFKPAGDAAPNLIPKEVFARLVNTEGREEEIQVLLPAMSGLNQIKEVVLTSRQDAARSVDLSITHFAFTPFNE